jgi:indolepyruvate decarboxylase
MTRDRLPVVVIVVNNGGYLLEKVLCKRKNSSYNNVPGWNYTALPVAFGAAPDSYWAMKVEHSSDLAAAWERGMKEHAAGKLVLFDMVTDPLDLPTPAAFLMPAKYLDE